MAKKALGMIEVKGLLGSIVAADVALKTANVQLVDQYTIKGGWTSVEFFGDVGAIKESISAAREATQPMECYISSNIIANLDPQVEEMIMSSIMKKKEAAEKKEATSSKAPVAKKEEAKVAEEPAKVADTKKEKQEKKETDETKPATPALTKAELKTKYKEFLASIDKADKTLEDLKVVELRSFAYLIELSSLTKKEIKFANKQTLLDHLRKEGIE